MSMKTATTPARIQSQRVCKMAKTTEAARIRAQKKKEPN